MKDFLDAFKHLEKICNEIYGAQSGVTQYINEMERTPLYMAQKVFGWDQDFQGLKRVHHIRNNMVHADSDGDTAYTFEDVQFMKNFYNRIMNREDPLALLRQKNEVARAKNKAISEPVSPNKIRVEPITVKPSHKSNERGLRALKIVFWIFIAILVIAFLAALGALILS